MAKKQQRTRPADVLPSGLYLAEITHSAGSLVGPAAIRFTIVFGEYKGQELHFIYGMGHTVDSVSDLHLSAIRDAVDEPDASSLSELHNIHLALIIDVRGGRGPARNTVIGYIKAVSP